MGKLGQLGEAQGSGGAEAALGFPRQLWGTESAWGTPRETQQSSLAFSDGIRFGTLRLGWGTLCVGTNWATWDSEKIEDRGTPMQPRRNLCSWGC